MSALDAGWDGAYYRVRSGSLEILFLSDPDEALDEVCNVDARIRLPDGSRWGATILTITEVERLMARWSSTGEALNGRYFWCSDGLIVKEPGLMPMAEVLIGLLDSGELRQILQRLDVPPGDPFTDGTDVPAVQGAGTKAAV
ncbi:hypothetical protein ACWD01_35405 [Streptomyces sp. NPDC002835]